MRHRAVCAAALLFASSFPGAAAISAQGKDSGEATLVVAGFDRRVVDEHRQLFDSSCIPMTIEMVLKLTGRQPADFFKLQEAWRNKTDGNFRDFDGKTVSGLTFHQQFSLPRNADFPLKRLFATIDKELNAGRYVIVSLKSGANAWHMHVIYGKDASGDFVAITKSGSKATGAKTVVVKHVKEMIGKMQGTDILTYEVKRTPKQK